MNAMSDERLQGVLQKQSQTEVNYIIAKANTNGVDADENANEKFEDENDLKKKNAEANSNGVDVDEDADEAFEDKNDLKN